MKTLLTLLLFAPTMALAQEGTVRYDMTVQLDIQLPPEMAQYQDEMPSSRTVTKVLAFNETGSLMTEAAGENAPEPSGGVMISAGQSEDETHVNFEGGTLTERRDFLGRTFLVTGEVPAWGWRLTGDQAEYLGYPVQKAVATRDSATVEAWFTSAIPVPAGPAHYGGLPGLILVLTEDGGRRTFEATEVSLGPLATGAVAVPREGRAVTREAFDRVAREKMAERGEGSRRRVFMIRQ